jgi:hypothetical protein
MLTHSWFVATALLLLQATATANTLIERDIDRRFPSEWCPIETRNVGGVENLVNFLAPANGTVKITFTSEYSLGSGYNGGRIDNVIVLEKRAFDRLKQVLCTLCFTSNPGAVTVPADRILGRSFVKFVEFFDTDPNLRASVEGTVWSGGSWYASGTDGSSAPHLSTRQASEDPCVTRFSGSWTLGQTAQGDSVSTAVVVGGLEGGTEYVVVAWFHVFATCSDPGFLGSDCATLTIRVDEAAPLPALPAQPHAPTGVGDEKLAGSPPKLELEALPNPASGAVSLAFEIPADGRATLKIYDITGQLVRTLIDAPTSAGSQTALWDLRSDEGREVAAGVYFYRLDAASAALTRKLTVAR